MLEVVENMVGRYDVPGRNDSTDNLIGVGIEQELLAGNRLAHNAVVETALIGCVGIEREDEVCSEKSNKGRRC